jgi:hypothetical protein
MRQLHAPDEKPRLCSKRYQQVAGLPCMYAVHAPATASNKRPCLGTSPVGSVVVVVVVVIVVVGLVGVVIIIVIVIIIATPDAVLFLHALRLCPVAIVGVAHAGTAHGMHI